MRIDWDRFPGDELTTTEAPAAREPLTPGEHEGTIEQATIQSGWRVSDDNPSGDCLSVWLDCVEDGAKKRIFVTVPVTNLRRIAVIARACGVEPPQRGNPDWDESQLVGKSCRVETSTYTVGQGPKAGEIRASVSRWLMPQAAQAQPQEAPKASKRKQSEAKKTFQGGADDIPF
jgi:hypothetical protein